MAYDRQQDRGQQQRNAPPVLERDVVASLLRRSFPKFKRITENDEKFGLVPLDAGREASFALQRIMSDKFLVECDAQSIRDAFENAAMLGLSLNPALQYAAVIPIWNDRRGIYEATLWPMYRGFIKLATDTGLITSVEVENVYGADKFDLTKGTDRTEISHTINHRTQRNTPENPYYGTYVLTRLVNDPARPLVEWVPEADVIKARAQSKNYDPNKPKGVWVLWEDEMRRKVAIKRAQKYWPKTDGRLQERLAQAVHMDNEIETGRSREEPIDIPKVESKITTDQAIALRDLAKEHKIRLERIEKVYFIDKIEDLPVSKFDEVKERLNNAGKKDKGNG